MSAIEIICRALRIYVEADQQLDPSDRELTEAETNRALRVLNLFEKGG